MSFFRQYLGPRLAGMGLAFLAGGGVTSLGWFLLLIGGIGPCGPSSTLPAEIGGVFAYYPFYFLCVALPWIDDGLSSLSRSTGMPLHVMASVAVSLALWTGIAYLPILLWKRRQARLSRDLPVARQRRDREPA